MAVDHRLLFPDRVQAIIANAQGLVVESLKGDVSARQYCRLRFPSVAAAQEFIQHCVEAKDPESERLTGREVQESILVAMLLTSAGASRASRVIVDVAGYIERCGVPVPALHVAIHDWGFLVIEDLGDVRLFDVFDEMDAQKLKDTYTTLVDCLIRMQFPPPSVPRDCVAHTYSFSAERFLFELKSFAEPFSRVILRRDLTQSEKNVVERTFPAISEEMMQQELLFTHRDYHSRNVMIKNDNLYIIDFQDARLGPILYDIVSLVFDPYVSLSPAAQQELIDYYLSELPAKSRNALRALGVSRAFDICRTQRCLKAAGTYAFMALKRCNKDFLRFIPHAIRSAQEAARRNADLLELSNMLAHWLERTTEFLQVSQLTDKEPPHVHRGPAKDDNTNSSGCTS